ncbi:MAG TPA: spermine synthase, partial [Caldilineae bacterium]|nr:spermine synthase [Caldilineae bacterium]
PIDGVELDPAIIAAGQRHFAMTEPNLRPIAQDGRYHLNHGAGTYDVIAIDAYRPPYIPFHLTTVEFFTEVRDHLTPDGVVAINVARTAADYSLIDALASTLAAVFPSVFVIDEPNMGYDLGNSLVVATMQPATLDDYLANTSSLPEPILAEISRRARPNVRVALATGPILTDDKAPIEQIIHGIVLRYLLGG